MDKETFEKTQPKLAKLFLNSRKSNRLSHAYLLYGEINSPLVDSAMYLAKSLYCTKDLLACNSCLECQKFEENNHPDFTFIDGRAKGLKKEDINYLSEKYSLGTVEKNHTACYVIGEISNITEEAANALLKFLEEPSTPLVAILTTTNIEKCLPTIVSRCVTIKVNPLSFKEVIKGNEDRFSREQAYALSLFAPTFKEMETLSRSDDFINAFQVAETFISDLVSSLEKAGFGLLKEGSGLLKTQKSIKYFATILIKVFSNVLSSNYSDSFSTFAISVKPYKDSLPKTIDVLADILNTLPANMNTNLSLARIINSLK